MTTVAGRHILPLLLLAALFFCILPVSASVFSPEITNDSVHYNVTTHIDPGTSTPFDIWVLAGLLSFVLFFISLTTPKSTAEGERDAIISVMAWVPIAFTAYASFAVDRVTAAGTTTTTDSGVILLENHVVYHFDVIGILFAVFFLIAVINTFRLLAIHKALRLQYEQVPAQQRSF